MASTILTLNKYTFSDKTLITTIFNGRADPNYYNTQGFLVKTVPLISVNENRKQTVEEFLKQDKYVLFTGTPCQCYGLKKYLGKNYEKCCG